MLIGRCLPYGEGITYWPLAEVAKAHAGILDNDPADVALAKLRARDRVRRCPTSTPSASSTRSAWTIGLASRTPVMDSRSARGGRRLDDGWARYLGALGREELDDLRRRGRPLGLRARCST